MIIRYVQLFYTTDYTAVVTMYMQFIHISKSMAKSKEKGTERKDFDEVVALLKKYTKELLMQQTNTNLHRDLYRFIDNEALEIYPEHQVERIKQKKAPRKPKEKI